MKFGMIFKEQNQIVLKVSFAIYVAALGFFMSRWQQFNFDLGHIKLQFSQY